VARGASITAGADVRVPMRAAAHNGREGPNLPPQRVARLRRDRCTSPRQRHTIGCQADDRRRLQRTTGVCNGRPALATDDIRRTTCERQPAAATTRQRRGAHRIDVALLGSFRRGWCVALRTSTCRSDRIGTRVRIAASSARTLRPRQYQQHEEHGRIFEWPASAKPGTGRRRAKLKFHWVRIVRRMRARSRCCEWRV
jgi:hypothetical protein